MIGKERVAVFSNMWQAHGFLLHGYGLTAVFLCSLGKLMLSTPILLPSEGKAYTLSVRCSGSQDLGCFCRAPISTMKKQSLCSRIVAQRLSKMQDTSMDEGQCSCSMAVIGWCEESSLQWVNSVAETQMGLSKDLQWSIYPYNHASLKI